MKRFITDFVRPQKSQRDRNEKKEREKEQKEGERELQRPAIDIPQRQPNPIIIP